MRLVFALVAVVALVVGCTPEAVESPTPTPSPVETTVTPSESPTVESPSPSPSPSPTVFQSYPVDLPTEDPETAAIIEGWQEYQRVYEKFAMDPSGYTDYTETQYVTTGQESTVILDRIDAFRNNNLELVKGRAFRDVVASPASDQADGTSIATITYCLDINQLEIRDTTTGELVERSGAFVETAHMRQGLDGIWRVEGHDSTGAEC